MMHVQQHSSGLRFLENLAYLVPGYQGYKQRDLRREEDSRLRARVYRRVRQMLESVGDLQGRWNGPTAQALLDELEQRRQHLVMIADAVRFAPGDRCEFFMVHAVRERQIEKILEADLLIFQDLDDAQAQMQSGRKASTAPRTVRTFLQVLDEKLRRLEQHLIMRERILSGG